MPALFANFWSWAAAAMNLACLSLVLGIYRSQLLPMVAVVAEQLVTVLGPAGGP